VSIAVRSDTGVGTLYCPSHELDVRASGAHRAKASWEASRYDASRDLRVMYGVAREDYGVSLVTHKPRGEDGMFLMLLSPGIAAADGDGAVPVLPKDAVFVLDTSGSMKEGGKLEQAKAALRYAISRLATRDRFNVVDFSGEARSFRDAPVPATRENVAAAMVYVGALEARGGTAIHEALVEALAIPRAEGRVPVVVFLTDGQPTIGPADPGAILGTVARTNGALARVFVFGVGNDVNTRLLDELADQTRGIGHYVAANESIERKVTALCDKIAHPVMTDIELTIEGASGDAGEYDVYPRRIGDLFRGQQITLVGRYARPGPCVIRLKGRVGEKTVEHVFEASLGEEGGRPYLARLWAVRKVGHLMREIRRNGEARELVAEIERLGTKHGIVTPYTSFLAVEAQEQLRRRLRSGKIRGRAMPDRERDSILSSIADLERAKAAAGDAGGAMREERESGRGAVAGARLTRALEGASTADSFTGVGVRRIGDKTFRYRDGVWVDQDLAGEAEKERETRRVAFLGEGYARLLRDAELARYLSVGRRVRVLHEGRIYVVE